MTFLKGLVQQLTGDIKAIIMQFYVNFMSQLSVPEFRQKEKMELDSFHRLSLFKILCSLYIYARYAFRSVTSTSPKPTKQTHLLIIQKPSTWSYFPDKYLQLVAAFYTKTTPYYPSQHTKGSLFIEISLLMRTMLFWEYTHFYSIFPQMPSVWKRL